MTAADASASPFEHAMVIGAAPVRVLDAFFEPAALAVWWQAIGSVTSPRPLGVFAVEWRPTIERDDLLGRLGGVFHGTVMEFVAGRELFVAEAWWMPPDGDPIGPMSLEVRCEPEGTGCRLTVRQSGFDDSPRWRRYYSVIERGWQSSLLRLKHHLEQPPL